VAVDPTTFREVLARWASGITVVTCRRPDGIHGMTASSFCSVSLEPPLVLVCVDRRARTHEYLQEAGAFAIHLLDGRGEEISNRCAGFQGDDGQKLDGESWRVEVTGAPVLDGTLAWMDCSLWRAYDGGDHTIYVGEVQAADTGEGEPLLWYRRGYRRLA